MHESNANFCYLSLFLLYGLLISANGGERAGFYALPRTDRNSAPAADERCYALASYRIKLQAPKSSLILCCSLSSSIHPISEI